MARLKKRLPRDFGDTVESGDLLAMQAVFETHSVDARDVGKTPALSTYAIPVELIRWLVAHGADIEQPDAYGETPLHHHARSWNGHPDVLIERGADTEARDGRGETPLFGARIHPRNVRALLQAGADVHAVNDAGQTALENWLERSGPGELAELAQTLALALDAGAEVTSPARQEIERLNHEYSRIREVYDEESIPEADAAISWLCGAAGIEQAAPPTRHDGVSPITVSASEWTEQYEELFAQLVPSAGHAPTAQGEAVRVATRVLIEIHDNGAINWDGDFRAMVDHFPQLLQGGAPLTLEQQSRLTALLRVLRTGRSPTDEAHELVRCAVTWVVHNPLPVPLAAVPYRR